jgi:hypothetical protein
LMLTVKKVLVRADINQTEQATMEKFNGNS